MSINRRDFLKGTAGFAGLAMSNKALESANKMHLLRSEKAQEEVRKVESIEGDFEFEHTGEIGQYDIYTLPFEHFRDVLPENAGNYGSYFVSKIEGNYVFSWGQSLVFLDPREGVFKYVSFSDEHDRSINDVVPVRSFSSETSTKSKEYVISSYPHFIYDLHLDQIKPLTFETRGSLYFQWSEELNEGFVGGNNYGDIYLYRDGRLETFEKLFAEDDWDHMSVNGMLAISDFGKKESLYTFVSGRQSFDSDWETRLSKVDFTEEGGLKCSPLGIVDTTSIDSFGRQSKIVYRNGTFFSIDINGNNVLTRVSHAGNRRYTADEMKTYQNGEYDPVLKDFVINEEGQFVFGYDGSPGLRIVEDPFGDNTVIDSNLRDIATPNIHRIHSANDGSILVSHKVFSDDPQKKILTVLKPKEQGTGDVEIPLKPEIDPDPEYSPKDDKAPETYLPNVSR